MLFGVSMSNLPEVPSHIEELLDSDETILYGAQQSRVAPTINPLKMLEKAIAPDSIWVTNRRVLVYQPRGATLGITRDIQDYPYSEMVNVFQHKGFLSSRIAVKMRFQNDPIILDLVPKGDVNRVYRVIRENLNKVQAGIFGTQQLPTAQSVRAPPPPPPPSQPQAYCPTCGKQATWIPQYSRFYCYGCQQYLDLPPPPP